LRYEGGEGGQKCQFLRYVIKERSLSQQTEAAFSRKFQRLFLSSSFNRFTRKIMDQQCQLWMGNVSFVDLNTL
jgi:hypothetical protein